MKNTGKFIEFALSHLTTLGRVILSVLKDAKNVLKSAGQTLITPITRARFMSYLFVGSVILISTIISGCALIHKDIVLYPIEKSDIVSMQKGQSYTPEKDGWFLSDLYMQKVEQAKVNQAKKTA